jgi:transcriptional regulator with XRE-family HTH domain
MWRRRRSAVPRMPGRTNPAPMGDRQTPAMDDLRFGSAIRAARVNRKLRQLDLAQRAGVSTGTVSRLERGQLEGMDLGLIRRVCRAVDVRVELVPRARAGDLDRLLNRRHSALGEAAIGWLATFDGWVVRPEVSFAVGSERGVIDLLAWHEATAALLVIELKTEIIDVGELLGTLDRKRRVGRVAAAEAGWRPSTVSTCLIVSESSTSRRRIEAHGRTFEAALPGGNADLRRWLTRPADELRALHFLSNGLPGSVRHGPTSSRRVRLRSVAAERASRARPEHELGAGDPPSGVWTSRTRIPDRTDLG